MLGLSVGLLPEKHDPTKSRFAYQCDITYGTGYEFGFDFLVRRGGARNLRASSHREAGVDRHADDPR